MGLTFGTDFEDSPSSSKSIWISSNRGLFHISGVHLDVPTQNLRDRIIDYTVTVEQFKDFKEPPRSEKFF